MMKRKIAGILLFAFLLMLSLGGCGEGKTAGNTNDLAVAYMEQKYGESFAYAHADGGKVSISSTDALFVTCDRFPGEEILVDVENAKFSNAEPVYHDNYFAVKYKQETIDFFRDCALTEFSDANVFYEVTELCTADLPADASFEDFLSDKTVTLFALIEVKEEEFVSLEQARRVADKIGESGADYYLTFVSVDESLYGQLSDEEINEKVRSNEFSHYAMISNDSGFTDEEWREADRS